MSGLSFKRISKVERFIFGARSISNFVYKLCTSSVLPTSELERCGLQKKTLPVTLVKGGRPIKAHGR